jgi:magnesium transporter
VIGRFEGLLRINVMLAFFLPGIVYLADAVGTQTETVIVRGLSLGVPMRRMIAREVLAGIVIGAALAVIAGPVVWWRWSDVDLALTVGVSVFAAASTSTVAAILLPWLLNSLKLDPAFGSGPFGDGRAGSALDLDLPAGGVLRLHPLSVSTGQVAARTT